jgi:hypothetical protein
MRKLDKPRAARLFLAMMWGLMLCAAATCAQHSKDIKQFAQEELVKDISDAKLHKVYFPDFIDHSGSPSLVGRHLAALLSASVAKKAKPSP